MFTTIQFSSTHVPRPFPLNKHFSASQVIIVIFWGIFAHSLLHMLFFSNKELLIVPSIHSQYPYLLTKSMNFMLKFWWSSVLYWSPSKSLYSLGGMADVSSSNRPSQYLYLPELVIFFLYAHNIMQVNLYHGQAPLLVTSCVGFGIFIIPDTVSLAYSGRSKIAE